MSDLKSSNKPTYKPTFPTGRAYFDDNSDIKKIKSVKEAELMKLNSSTADLAMMSNQFIRLSTILF